MSPTHGGMGDPDQACEEGDGWALPSATRPLVPERGDERRLFLEDDLNKTAGAGRDVTPQGPFFSYIRARTRP